MTSESMPVSRSSSPRLGWTAARPATVPGPSGWPAALALAITFLAWAIVTSLIVAIAGLALFVVSLAGWIGEIRHERDKPKP